MADTFRDVINAWPGITEFASDLGISEDHARTIRRRDSIPATYWHQTVAGAKRRRIEGVSLKLLAELKAKARTIQPERRPRSREQEAMR